MGPQAKHCDNFFLFVGGVFLPGMMLEGNILNLPEKDNFCSNIRGPSPN